MLARKEHRHVGAEDEELELVASSQEPAGESKTDITLAANRVPHAADIH
jgi:hypothetical protein